MRCGLPNPLAQAGKVWSTESSEFPGMKDASYGWSTWRVLSAGFSEGHPGPPFSVAVTVNDISIIIKDQPILNVPSSVWYARGHISLQQCISKGCNDAPCLQMKKTWHRELGCFARDQLAKH